ncbi:MAG TPA: hypothetical protein VGC70_04015 [Burkholderiales bacterium]
MTFQRTLGFIVLLTMASVVAFAALYLAAAYVAIFVLGLAHPWPRGGEWVLFLVRLKTVLPWYTGLYLVTMVMAWRLIARFSASRGIGHVLASAAASATMYILVGLPSNRSPFTFVMMPVGVVVIVFVSAVMMSPRGQPPTRAF